MSLVPAKVDGKSRRKSKYSPHNEYILCLLDEMRKANEKAIAASARWEIVSEQVNRRLDRLGIKSKWERTKDRREDIDLDQAFNEWHFWQREAVRIAETITAEYHARQMVLVLPDRKVQIHVDPT